jgi:hypothetical protein
MNDTQDVIEIRGVATRQRLVSALGGGPTDELRQRFAPDRGRPLEPTFKLGINPKTLHHRIVSHSTRCVIHQRYPRGVDLTSTVHSNIAFQSVACLDRGVL